MKIMTLRKLQFAALFITAFLLSACSSMGSQPTQSVKLVMPANGSTVTSPFKVQFAVEGLKVEPAGDIVANSGHHHLLINMQSIKAGEAIPFTPQHLHFGKAQTEAEVKLNPGTYTLTAQFANGAHESYGQKLSDTITITVK